jgi:hypothetical protein
MTNTKTLYKARLQARAYSDKYNTHWYVREVSQGVFEAWAHDSEDKRTVAKFYCGREETPL